MRFPDKNQAFPGEKASKTVSLLLLFRLKIFNGSTQYKKEVKDQLLSGKNSVTQVVLKLSQKLVSLFP